MKIKFLARPLDWLEKKYVSKSGYDSYLDLAYSRSALHNKPIGSIDCSDISRRKNERNFIPVGYLEKYFSEIYKTKKTIEEWAEDNKNSSDIKAKRLSFVFRGQALKNKLAEEFANTDDKFHRFDSVVRYDSLLPKDRKKLLLYILGELSKLKYKSNATEKGKKKLIKFFEKMSIPFASVCEQWYNKDNQQEMFNPIKTYPIEQEDWFKQEYKNKEEWQEAMKKEEEEYYDDCCRYCGA
tara:strand:- start:142 stop:858 length:717 start_codon:yes stop_codon:yes gene_type:complete